MKMGILKDGNLSIYPQIMPPKKAQNIFLSLRLWVTTSVLENYFHNCSL